MIFFYTVFKKIVDQVNYWHENVNLGYFPENLRQVATQTVSRLDWFSVLAGGAADYLVDGLRYRERTQDGSSATTLEWGGSGRFQAFWNDPGSVYFTQSAKERRARTHTHTHAHLHTVLIKFISYDLKNIYLTLLALQETIMSSYCKVFFNDTQVTRGADGFLCWNETWPEIDAITLFF